MSSSSRKCTKVPVVIGQPIFRTTLGTPPVGCGFFRYTIRGSWSRLVASSAEPSGLSSMTKTSQVASRCRSTLEIASSNSPGRRKVGMTTEKSTGKLYSINLPCGSRDCRESVGSQTTTLSREVRQGYRNQALTRRRGPINLVRVALYFTKQERKSHGFDYGGEGGMRRRGARFRAASWLCPPANEIKS